MYNPDEDENGGDLTPEETWEAEELYKNMVEAMLELDDKKCVVGTT